MADTKWSAFPAASTVALTDSAVGLVGGANNQFTLTVLQAALTKLGVVTVTQPGTSATLTLANGSTLATSGANSITLTSTGATNVTLPTSGTLMTNPMTTGGDVIYGGASGVPTRLANGSANQVLTSQGTTLAPVWATPGAGSGTVTNTGALTANRLIIGNAGADVTALGSLGTTTTLLHGNAAGAPTFGAVNLATDVTGVIPTAINAQTGTTYTVVAGDQGKLVTFSNGAAVAVTLPQATGSFTTGWSCSFLNLGAGIVTVTPTTSTWNAAATVKLRTGQGGVPVSDGTNYQGPVYQVANALTSATTVVDTSAATAPSSGQVLTATSGSAATWQTPGGGSATPGTVIGCQPIWISATQLSIGSGYIYIESTGAIIAVAAQTVTPSSPSASTMYHGYINASGVLAFATAVPVAFATPCGFARSKTGDTASRYVYSCPTDGSGHFYGFVCNQRGDFKYHGPNTSSAPFRWSGSPFSGTSSTTVDFSAIVPVTAQSIYIFPENLSSNNTIAYIASGDLTVSSSLFDTQVNAPDTIGVTAGGNISFYAYTPCSSTQTLSVIMSGSGGAFYIDGVGFQLQR